LHIKTEHRIVAEVLWVLRAKKLYLLLKAIHATIHQSSQPSISSWVRQVPQIGDHTVRGMQHPLDRKHPVLTGLNREPFDNAVAGHDRSIIPLT
jgi:hypothetical protein